MTDQPESAIQHIDRNYKAIWLATNIFGFVVQESPWKGTHVELLVFFIHTCIVMSMCLTVMCIIHCRTALKERC